MTSKCICRHHKPTDPDCSPRFLRYIKDASSRDCAEAAVPIVLVTATATYTAPNDFGAISNNMIELTRSLQFVPVPHGSSVSDYNFVQICCIMAPSLPLIARLFAAKELVDWKGLEIELLAWLTLLPASTHLHAQNGTLLEQNHDIHVTDLIVRSPSMMSLQYSTAVFTLLHFSNSMKANRVWWLLSPAILTKVIYPQTPEKIP